MNKNEPVPAGTFVAIDVEWATRDQQICQIALAVVCNGEIAEHAEWLVQPPGNLYDETLFSRHQVRPEMTGKTDVMLVGTWHVGLPKLAKYEKQAAKRFVALIVGDEDLEAFLYGEARKFFT